MVAQLHRKNCYFVRCVLSELVLKLGARGSLVLRHYATSRKVAGSLPDEVDIINLPNPSSRIMALGSTQPLTEMSARNLKKKKTNPGGKVRPARRADNIAAIF
jgi:hypothetical protein